MRALLFVFMALPPLYLLMLGTCLLWPVHETALATYEHEEHQTPRLVATDLRKSNQRDKTPDGGREGWKAYVLFPSLLSEPKVVTVTVLPDGARVVSESVAEFWVRAGLALASLTWLAWLVVSVARQKPRFPEWTERDRRRDEAFRNAR